MQLNLDQHEADVLLEVLKNHLPELREEVYKTENFEWRQQMKADEVVIKDLIGRLSGESADLSGDDEPEAQDSTDAEFVFGAVVTTTE